MINTVLLGALESSMAEMGGLLLEAASNHPDGQDWQPEMGEWSLRYIAAHMRQVEIDCHWNRVMRLANNENPHYTYYLNTGWDFSRFDLTETVKDWQRWRRWVIDWCLGVSAEQLTHTGTHDSFGTITIPKILQIAIDHDQEHIDQLKKHVS